MSNAEIDREMARRFDAENVNWLKGSNESFGMYETPSEQSLRFLVHVLDGTAAVYTFHANLGEK